MDISFKKVENGKIILINEDLKPGNWQEKSDWIPACLVYIYWISSWATCLFL
ncbi:hypothetical protein QWY87_04325 [Lutimonas halocynthiae]|uniref:hypothetical protein n=1 Tax=Lutimonas halocynthiae TaxID=1446477 RepID=UPI0025B4531C|nr:hypothetical protein [Lutimonas halocynthiae]MDN3641912.1 hypothetical protein [Lutimonas halocynthiae]